MACNIHDIQAAACESGIGKVQNSVPLLQLVAQLLCEISEQGGGSQTPWTQDINAANHNITNLGTINGKKVYRALISQAGTAAPTAVILENSLGGTPAFSRSSAGAYTVTLTGAFPLTKTFFGGISLTDNNVPFSTLGAFRVSVDGFRLDHLDGSGTPVDEFSTIPIEVIVYP